MRPRKVLNRRQVAKILQRDEDWVSSHCAEQRCVGLGAGIYWAALILERFSWMAGIAERYHALDEDEDEDEDR